MKKVIAIFFASLLLFNSTGLLFFYLLEIQDCKTEAGHYSSDGYNFSKNTIISFVKGEGDFQLLNEKEIVNDGMLFDVLNTETNDGKIIYHTIRDDKEENFLAGLSKLVKDNSNAGSIPGKNVAPDVLKYIGDNKNSFQIAVCQLPTVNCQLPVFYHSPFLNIFSPPPEGFIS